MKALLFSLGLMIAAYAKAQSLPPVDIPIPNIPQQTPVWCWAAVAQQIILATRGQAHTPPQCALVAIANNAAPNACCAVPNPQCLRTGSFSQVAGLIAQYGGRLSNYVPPANPMVLYQTLASGRAILLHVKTGQSTTHVVVLRGMSFMQTPFGVEPILHINDPMAYFTQPVPYSTILPIWIDALVVN